MDRRKPNRNTRGQNEACSWANKWRKSDDFKSDNEEDDEKGLLESSSGEEYTGSPARNTRSQTGLEKDAGAKPDDRPVPKRPQKSPGRRQMGTLPSQGKHQETSWRQPQTYDTDHEEDKGEEKRNLQLPIREGSSPPARNTRSQLTTGRVAQGGARPKVYTTLDRKRKTPYPIDLQPRSPKEQRVTERPQPVHDYTNKVIEVGKHFT